MHDLIGHGGVVAPNLRKVNEDRLQSIGILPPVTQLPQLPGARVGQIKRAIPDMPWYLTRPAIVGIYGPVIFSTIFYEFSYIMESVWRSYMIYAMFGILLDLPQWLLNLSPFQHVPALPAASMSWPPIVVLTAIAAALIVMKGLRGACCNREDVAEGAPITAETVRLWVMYRKTPDIR